MADVFQQLARHLDNLPAGFPATESGVELRILKRLFTEDEAEIARNLTLMPEPASNVAQRIGRDESELADILESMAQKGLLYRSAKGGQNHYSAAQFMVGIWEYHLNDLDKDLIRDVNEYTPYLIKTLWAEQDTKQLRVVPVSKSISAEASVMPYEAAENIIRQQSKIVVSPCICRRESDIMGHSCDKPLEACLSFGSGAYYYEKNGLGRSITQEEALDILKKGAEAGLVLQPGNSKKAGNICMCCGCCCQVLKNLKALGSPAKAVHTNYYAEVVEDECIACGVCADRCQMDAITIEDTALVNLDKCIGCGLCVTHCPTEAMTLKQKDAADQYVPPENTFETYMNMARERGKV